ncbi:integrase catalytic domain-containing protein [Trichonephila clavipes]|nr:integrase catalytic domain-containing protein [Trichonephila clavipes]
MQEVDEREECGMYFIPHLGVYRSDKKTSKLRVVFNASSATTNGYSLNSLQYNGGVAQNDLFSIMVRFRKHIFAFIADVQKMYRMIWINPDQRKLQRILWRENMDEPIKTFELSTVTYGTTSAPFLATRTLKQLALDEAGNFPLGSSVVMSDMYIDDVLTGAETLLEAKELKNQLINIFAKGGMVLHKWCGNNTELIEVSENYDFSDSSEIKVLGVYWNPKHDCFSFRVKIDLHELNTKRDVLSTIARIYDPLGLLGPVVAKAKIFLQKLWMLKIDWTDLLPDTINREWRQFVESLQVVNDININRCIVVEQPEVIELHGFSDASQSAYGAVVYCKSITSDGKMLVHLIASKSRVAPTKQTTIPRLELCAAVLLAKLVHRVKQALKLNVTNTFLWSDSMIVLSWIRKESYQLKTFVANRIATIQEMTSSEQWRYVATEDNPADFVSRGMDSLKLKTCELWWNGPKFLMSNQYPQRQIPVAVIKDPGRSITSIVEPDLTDLNENRLDNWQKITKIIQLIWKRWSVDYLNSLQQRNKWHFEKKNAKIGDMVIIKEDNLPSCQWSLGRINNIYPGKDSKFFSRFPNASGLNYTRLLISWRVLSKLCFSIRFFCERINEARKGRMINLPETKKNSKRGGVCFSTRIDFCQLEEEGLSFCTRIQNSKRGGVCFSTRIDFCQLELFSDSSCARPQVKNRDKISNARKRHFVKQSINSLPRNSRWILY